MVASISTLGIAFSQVLLIVFAAFIESELQNSVKNVLFVWEITCAVTLPASIVGIIYQLYKNKH